MCPCRYRFRFPISNGNDLGKGYGIPHKVEVQETQTTKGGQVQFWSANVYAKFWGKFLFPPKIVSPDVQSCHSQGRWAIAASPQHCCGEQWGKCVPTWCVHIPFNPAELLSTCFWVYECPKTCWDHHESLVWSSTSCPCTARSGAWYLWSCKCQSSACHGKVSPPCKGETLTRLWLPGYILLSLSLLYLFIWNLLIYKARRVQFPPCTVWEPPIMLIWFSWVCLTNPKQLRKQM